MSSKIFSPIELDAIGEILNISLGASATAISTMLTKRVDITTPHVEVVDFDEFDYTEMDPAIDHHRSFRDAHGTFTEEQVKTETARCLGCGASVVDPNKCIGCGICTTKCEFDAIHLNRELPECSRMVRSEDKFKAILPYMIKREMKIRFGKKDG